MWFYLTNTIPPLALLTLRAVVPVTCLMSFYIIVKCHSDSIAPDFLYIRCQQSDSSGERGAIVFNGTHCAVLHETIDPIFINHLSNGNTQRLWIRDTIQNGLSGG